MTQAELLKIAFEVGGKTARDEFEKSAKGNAESWLMKLLHRGETPLAGNVAKAVEESSALAAPRVPVRGQRYLPFGTQHGQLPLPLKGKAPSLTKGMEASQRGHMVAQTQGKAFAGPEMTQQALPLRGQAALPMTPGGSQRQMQGMRPVAPAPSRYTQAPTPTKTLTPPEVAPATPKKAPKGKSEGKPKTEVAKEQATLTPPKVEPGTPDKWNAGPIQFGEESTSAVSRAGAGAKTKSTADVAEGMPATRDIASVPLTKEELANTAGRLQKIRELPLEEQAMAMQALENNPVTNAGLAEIGQMGSQGGLGFWPATVAPIAGGAGLGYLIDDERGAMAGAGLGIGARLGAGGLLSKARELRGMQAAMGKGTQGALSSLTMQSPEVRRALLAAGGLGVGGAVAGGMVGQKFHREKKPWYQEMMGLVPPAVSTLNQVAAPYLQMRRGITPEQLYGYEQDLGIPTPQ